MRITGSLVAAALAAITTTVSAQSKLTLQVFTSSPAGFLVNSTLVSGSRDAVLIDAQFTRADAHRLVATLIESKKNLTTVYVTHAHPDHYFGLEVIRQAFPAAKLVALPSTVVAVRQTWKAKVDQWRPLYGSTITDAPPIPEPLAGTSLTLDGETLQIVGPVQGDDAENSYVWIPSHRAVIAGDIVYSGVHVWTAETNAASRRAWAATLDRIDALNPAVVVAGHQNPALGTTPASVTFTKQYLAAFDDALASSRTAEELQGKVKAKYGDLALDVILGIGAQAAFKAAR
jgi:glyoxylase-like metal-dependent hydrolase (beta-lactamase superfamily II)